MSFKHLKSRLSTQIDSASTNTPPRRPTSQQSAANDRRSRRTSDTSSIGSEVAAGATNDQPEGAVQSNSRVSPGTSTPLNTSLLSLNSIPESDSYQIQFQVDRSNQHISASEITDDLESVTSVDDLNDDQRSMTSYTPDQLHNAYVKNAIRLQKYKTRLKTAFTQNEELSKEQEKLKKLLETSQDKYMRKISELKEAALLDKEIKTHMEQTLQADIDEKTEIIDSLNQKVNYLKGNLHLSEKSISEKDEVLTETNDILTKYENFLVSLEEDFSDVACSRGNSLALLNHCLDFVSQLGCTASEKEFDPHNIQNSLETESKSYRKSIIIEKIRSKIANEFTAVEDKQRDLEQNNLKINYDYQDIDAKLKQKESEFLSKNEEVTSLNDQLNSIQGHAANLENNEIVLRNDVKESREKLILSVNEVESLKGEIESWKLGVTESERMCENINRQLREFEAKHDSLAQDNSSLKQSVIDMESQNHELSNKLETATVAFDLERGAMTGQIKSMEDNISSLQSSNLEMTFKLDEVSNLQPVDEALICEDQVMQVEASLTEAEVNFVTATAHTQRADSVASIDGETQTSSHDVSECILASCSNDKCLLQAEITSLNARIEGLLGEIENMSRIQFEKNSLTDRIKVLEDEKSTLEDSVTSIAKDRDSKVAMMTKQVKELSQELECKSNELETLSTINNDDYENCALENVEIKRTYFQLHQDFDSMKESLLLEKEQALNELTLSLKEKFNGELRDVTNIKTKLSKELESTKVALKDAEDNFKSASVKESKLASDVKELHRQLESSYEQVKTLTQSNSELRAELSTRVTSEVYQELLTLKSNLDTKCELLENDIKQKTESFGHERDNFTAKIDQLEQAFVDANAGAEKTTQLLDQYVSSFEERLAKLKFELDQSQDQVVRHKSAIEVAEKQNTEISEKRQSDIKKYEDLTRDQGKMIMELKGEVAQLSHNIKERTSENEGLLQKVDELEGSSSNLMVSLEKEKSKHEEYKKKVEERFSSQKQIITEKMKAKDKLIEEKGEENKQMQSKVLALKEEKDFLLQAQNENLEKVEKLQRELADNQKLLNVTLEQSQLDAENLKRHHTSEVEKLMKGMSDMQHSHEESKSDEVGRLVQIVDDLRCQLDESNKSYEVAKSELLFVSQLADEAKKKFETEKSESEQRNLVAGSQLSEKVGKISAENKDLKEKIASVNKDFNDHKKTSESELIAAKEQIETIKSSANRDRLSKDREIKTQSEELYKLRDNLQKMKNRHSEEVSDIKTKHSTKIKEFEDQLKESEFILQTAKTGAQKAHEETIKDLKSSHANHLAKLSAEYENRLQNVASEYRKELELVRIDVSGEFQKKIDAVQTQLGGKDLEIENLQADIVKYEAEISAFNSDAFEKKYEDLLMSSQSEIKRLEKRHDSKMRNLENKLSEEQRKSEKHIQEHKLIIANLEFEMEDLDSNYRVLKSKNEMLSKEAKLGLKNEDLKSALESKEAEIQRLEESARIAMESREAQYQQRLRIERDRIVKELDEFYAEKYAALSPEPRANTFEDVALQSNSSQNSQPAVLTSPQQNREHINFSFEDPTQMQFLRRILKQFIMGGEKVVMAKVLVKLAQFGDSEADDLLNQVKYQSERWL